MPKIRFSSRGPASIRMGGNKYQSAVVYDVPDDAVEAILATGFAHVIEETVIEETEDDGDGSVNADIESDELEIDEPEDVLAPVVNEDGKYDCRFDGCDRVGEHGFIREINRDKHENGCDLAGDASVEGEEPVNHDEESGA